MYVRAPELISFPQDDMREDFMDAIFDYTVVWRHESIYVDCVTKNRAFVTFYSPEIKTEMHIQSGMPFNVMFKDKL